jgi:hypothetical protein
MRYVDNVAEARVQGIAVRSHDYPERLRVLLDRLHVLLKYVMTGPGHTTHTHTQTQTHIQ